MATNQVGGVSTGDGDQPALALAIHRGDAEQSAVSLGDGIWMSRGVGNVYLVTTGDGDVLINTGLANEADRHRRRLAAVSDAPIRAIIFTQGHGNQIGGWSTFAAPGTETIAHRDFHEVREYWTSLASYYTRRTRKLWGGDLQQTPESNDFPEPVITTTFADSFSFEVGGRRFELYSTPGGETTDSLTVWLPMERTIFIGNLMGPIVGHIPNLYTIRGDKIRSARAFTRSVQTVMDLDPSLLVSGRGDQLRGGEVLPVLARVRDAVDFLRSQTIGGMNAGTDLFTLMSTVKLPAELAVAQGHGRVPWVVRAIWEEYAGWFRFESTTELYDVPARRIWPDLVVLAGASGLTRRGRSHLDDDRPLEALHLADIALDSEPAHPEALALRAAALRILLDRSGHENFSETRWLQAEIAETEAALAAVD